MKIKRFYSKTLLLILLCSGVFLATDGKRFVQIAQSMDQFVQAYRLINENYVDPTDPNELMQVAIDSMMASLDPYTVYYSESEINTVRMGVKGGWDGIGVELAKRDSNAMVKLVMQGSPAEKMGIKAGDFIQIIDGTEIKNQSIEVVTTSLQGKAGTKVAVTFFRPMTKETFEKSFERATVKKENVPYYGMLNDSIGYIILTTFSDNASGNIRDAYIKLKQDFDMKHLVLDLRNNGGGLLLEAVHICNLFVPKGKEIVYTKNRLTNLDKSFTTTSNPQDIDIPLVVLMNGKSASASEIVAGALQDLDRAVLMGQASFGKGLVQNTKDVGFNSKIKLTIAKYYIPSGRCVQALEYKKGIGIERNDSLRTKFKTAIGRTVLDGRLQPDVRVDKPVEHPLIKALKEQFVLFDYANLYKSRRDSIGASKTFRLTTKEFANFEDFVANHTFTFEYKANQLLRKLEQENKRTAALENVAKKIRSRLEKQQKSDFEKLKPEIKRLLEAEIVTRYYYENGGIQNQLNQDKEVRRAVSLLKNTNAYNSLLKP